MSFSLDLIEVASPCSASWDEMAGDDRVRFCRQCKLNVYNLSEMSREEAERFIRDHTAGQASSGTHRTCVRFYRRADGTVLTRDCPVGLKALRQRLARSLAATAGLMMALIGGTLFGEIISRRTPGGLTRPWDAFANWMDPRRRCNVLTGKVAMGGCSAPPPGLSAPPQLTPASTKELQPIDEQNGR